jgi:hypothetical protein
LTVFSDREESSVRAAFAVVRELEPSEEIVACVVAQTRREGERSSRLAGARVRSRLVVAAAGVLALLAATLYSVPVTRAALEEAGGSVGGVFTGWLGGDSAEAPGRPLGAGEEAPRFLYEGDFAKDPRVIAEAGGYKLYAFVEPSGGLGYDLGDTGVGGGIPRDQLGDAPLEVLGPGAMQHPDRHGYVPLFGFAARSVESVELTYESGPALRVDGVEGGFVLLAEPRREPREVIALNASGERVGSQLIDYSRHPGVRIDWRQYLPGFWEKHLGGGSAG